MGRTILHSIGDRVVAVVRKSLSGIEGSQSFEGSPQILLENIPSVAEATLIWLAVPDSVISEVVDHLCHISIPPQVSLIVHSSGALGTEVLAPLESEGRVVAGLHPNLILVGNAGFPSNTIWGVTPSSLSDVRLRKILGVVNHQFLPIENSMRPLYHAAATLVANYPLLLAENASALYSLSGVGERDARTIMAQYLRRVADSVEHTPSGASLLRSLTGPVARGDSQTLDLQIERIVEKGLEHTATLLQTLIELTRGQLEQK